MKKLTVAALAATGLAASSAMSGPSGPFPEPTPFAEKCGVIVSFASTRPDKPVISMPTSDACAKGTETALAVTLATVVRAAHEGDSDIPR